MILFFKLNIFLGYPDGRGSSHQQQVSCYGYKVRFFPMKMLAKVLFTHCYTWQILWFKALLLLSEVEITVDDLECTNYLPKRLDEIKIE